MNKLILLASVMALPLMSNAVSAQTAAPVRSPPQGTISCSSELTRTNDFMRAATDIKKKETATQHLDRAKDATARNDEQGCIQHAGEAIKALY